MHEEHSRLVTSRHQQRLQSDMLRVIFLCTGLLSKLQDTGSKDDVKVPLRVLRDEIGRVYFKRFCACPACIFVRHYLLVSQQTSSCAYLTAGPVVTGLKLNFAAAVQPIGWRTVLLNPSSR